MALNCSIIEVTMTIREHERRQRQRQASHRENEECRQQQPRKPRRYLRKMDLCRRYGWKTALSVDRAWRIYGTLPPPTTWQSRSPLWDEAIGLLDVERAIADARPEDYVGVLIPGGAKSPALLAEDPRVTKFVQEVSARGGVIACICRGSLLAARSKVVAGHRMTGFNDSVSYPELVVQPDAEAAGATWVQDAPVVVDRNLVTSPHPRHSAAFAAAIVAALRDK
jgi:putative intracellular protease/amidase